MEFIKDKIYDSYTGDFMALNDFASRYKLDIGFVKNMKEKGWSSEEIKMKERREDTLRRCFG